MLFVAGLGHVLAIVVTIWREGLKFNPFHIVNIGFVTILWNEFFGLLLYSEKGIERGAIYTIDFEVKLFLLLMSICFIGCASMFGRRKTRAKNSRADARYEYRIRLEWLALLALGLMVIDTVYMTSRLGSVPIVALANYGTEISQQYRTALTGISLAGFRFVVILLAIRLAGDERGFKQHFARHKVTYLILVAISFCYLLGGKRNLLITNAIILLLGCFWGRSLRVSRQVALVTTFFLLSVVFIVYGNYRRQGSAVNDFTKHLNLFSDSALTRGVGTWLIRYSGTSVRNFSSVAELYPYEAKGSVLASQMFPNALYYEIIPHYPSAIEFLHENLLLPNPGLTFRTFYADLVPDFGLWGTFLLSVILVVMLHRLYIKGHKSFWVLFLLLNFLPGLLFMPLMNRFLGMQHLLPIIMGAVCVRKRSLKLAKGIRSVGAAKP